MNPLIDTAPGFDQPIAVLKHCHDRIRKQLGTLERLLVHLPEFGADLDAQQAASSIMQYFNKAADKHHADEEQDLLPMLEATATDDDGTLLHSLMPELLQQHRQMDASWQVLNRQLTQIASGDSADLSEKDVKDFTQMYTAHMVTEETHIAPMAKRIFSSAQMTQLGEAMRARRNIT
jgi:pyridoxamine 5'-phosphate oxidase